MKIAAFKNHFFDTLAGEYPREEIGSFFSILTQEFFNLSRLEVALYPQYELSKEEKDKFESALQRLQQHEPVQYITGHTQFFGLPFNVNQNVLIPRPETEELVAWILEDVVNSEEIKILDIGTGSGCVAIALAKQLPHSVVTAIDISEEALEVARANASTNEVEIDFFPGDVLNIAQLHDKFDIIVSNPPYVRELEKKDMQRNVLEHEPETALYVKDSNPLIFYQKITDLAENNLKPGGKLYFEINQYLGKETEALLTEKNFQTRLKKDIFGVDRMLRGIKL
ncbi:peptide chain release factor N(5)-glutamine methyltransferase [Salinimicrobium sediminilitoris]|uniref:peptide chain release factor N(5)-glutamine methyltransferase n=1 Tax=Salinimicrobium sediminilitoris TaxID=2876715 RepID=UPI001E2A42AE|nr:peptide chain release factor N(5)-glutamine methyltransferase [Salinimicrobium sediminilitoris]MCC8361270.1 peptide chain release factor N(5)-glutamine methyltransferase [Salinimicrobium sediminilitoris]